jgi:divalent metal cation (Fe/Co/Zn/Cd) transporter
LVNYIVLALGCVVEGFSLHVALRDVNHARGDLSILQYIHKSKSPVSFTVLLEDSAAVGGMVIAFLGILLSDITGVYCIDSAASILIGCVMFVVALVLLNETRSLLIGEGLDPNDVKEIEFLVEQDPAVIKCGRILSMYQSPDDVVLAIDVTFDDELEEGDLLKGIDRIEASIIDEYPQCSSIFIEAESLNQVYRQRYDRKNEFKRLEEEEEDDEKDKEDDK